MDELSTKILTYIKAMPDPDPKRQAIRIVTLHHIDAIRHVPARDPELFRVSFRALVK